MAHSEVSVFLNCFGCEVAGTHVGSCCEGKTESLTSFLQKLSTQKPVLVRRCACCFPNLSKLMQACFISYLPGQVVGTDTRAKDRSACTWNLRRSLSCKATWNCQGTDPQNSITRNPRTVEEPQWILNITYVYICIHIYIYIHIVLK